jgi:hypothetical protein
LCHTAIAVAHQIPRCACQTNAQGKYNLLLVLTGGGRLNFAGARVWADQADARLLASIELTVCLDALAAGDKLYLHVSRPAKDPIIGQLFNVRTSFFALCVAACHVIGAAYRHDERADHHACPSPRQSLKVAGATAGVEVELVHKKINISDPNIAWEHEVFSRKRIPAGTISHFPQHSAALFSRSNVLDTTYPHPPALCRPARAHSLTYLSSPPTETRST